jgi:hypothetical protein
LSVFTPREAALTYAARGWRVFPCRDKQPLVKGGFHAASVDVEQIREWWDHWTEAQVGWALPEGLLVVDVDPKSGGFDSLVELQESVAAWPETLTQCTASGGMHYVFRVPEGATARQRAGWLPGIDTRVGGRGYVILPPSRSSTGRAYAWVDERDPVDAPPELLERFAARARVTKSTPGGLVLAARVEHLPEALGDPLQ